jgi:peptidoglycan lytic transglycosylase
MSHTRKTRRRVAAGILIALLTLGTATAAGAHPSVAKWWQYDTSTWHHTWHDYAKYRYRDHRWHRHHPNATFAEVRAKHRRLRNHYRGSRFHRAIGWQQGQATWYDGRGLRGACGQPLVGLYAASRTLPCGSLVSVRSNGHYVLVHILDRGPYGSSSRIIDLSPSAFQHLAPLGAGVIGVSVVHLSRS